MQAYRRQLPPRDLDSRITLLAVGSCFSLTIFLGLLSNGAYHDDDLTHFLMARWAHWFPEFLLHVWGRPGATIPLAAVAWFSDADLAWHAARILSATVTAATALLAARLAVRMGLRHAWLVVVACYLQPLNTVLACTTLTENFAAFYLIAAVVLSSGNRRIAGSAVFSLALLTRHEALVLLPIWWLSLLAAKTSTRTKAAACLIALWAPAAHNIMFRLVLDGWPAAVFLHPHGSTEYPPISPLGYLPHALLAVPPVIAGLALIGGTALARRGNLLIPAFPAVFLMTHLAIKASGMFASGGYARFMVTVTPFVAILAVAGLQAFVQRLRDRRPTGWLWLTMAVIWPIGLAAFEIERRAGRIATLQSWPAWLLSLITAAVVISILAAWAMSPSSRRPGRKASAVRKTTTALLVLTCAIQWAYFVRPLSLGENQRQVRRVCDWLRHQGLDDAPLFATNPWIAYFMNQVENPRAHKDARLLASMPVNTIFIWDSIYSDSDYHRLPRTRFEDDPHYQLLETFGPVAPGRMEMWVFHKTAETAPPPEPQTFYPPVFISEEKPFSGIYYIRADDR